ncbi:MAG: hypothetical protein ACRC9M_01075 [Aeromonas sp.]
MSSKNHSSEDLGEVVKRPNRRPSTGRVFGLLSGALSTELSYVRFAYGFQYLASLFRCQYHDRSPIPDRLHLRIQPFQYPPIYRHSNVIVLLFGTKGGLTFCSCLRVFAFWSTTSTLYAKHVTSALI